MAKLSPGFRRKLLVLLLRIEGICVLGLGSFLIVKGLISDDPIEWFVISGILLLALFGGIGLIYAAKSFKTKKNFGRAPAILSNLIAIGVSKYMAEASLWLLALPIALIAATVIILTLMETSEAKKLS